MSDRRSLRKEKRSQKHRGMDLDFAQATRVPDVKRKEFRPATAAQSRYYDSIVDNVLTIATGSAGTGKTYVPAAIAAEQLREDPQFKLIICRPKVTAGEDFGHLPGELVDKYKPFIEPFKDALEDRLGVSFVESLIKSGRISAKPLAFMRGKSFKNCMVILDEAQNVTQEQMELFLTRIGDDCKVVVDGDVKQLDIRNSGLWDAVNRLGLLPQVGVVNFTIDDCVRSKFCKQMLLAYQ